MLERRRSILTFGILFCILAAGLLVLSAFGVNDAYDWDVQRCGPIAGEWYPEWVWLIFVGPLALAGLLVGAVTLWAEFSRRGEWVSRLLLGVCGLLVVGASALAWLSRFGPCPPTV